MALLFKTIYGNDDVLNKELAAIEGAGCLVVEVFQEGCRGEEQYRVLYDTTPGVARLG